MTYRTLRMATGLLGAALLLASCQQQAADKSSASANPDAKPGLSVDGGTLILPAVKGNPAAAYFAVSNRGGKGTEIAALHINGAEQVEMHETVNGSMQKIDRLPIGPGETVTFERGGRHAMLFGLADTITAGGTTEMTIVFVDGDKVSTPLAVKSAGNGGGNADDMAGMDHAGGEH